MAVFTALKNKAGQVAAGLAGSAVKSALGLNRAQPAFGPTSEKPQSSVLPSSPEYFQYPKDLSSNGNSHFILFTCRRFEGKSNLDATKGAEIDATVGDESGGSGRTAAESAELKATQTITAANASGRGPGSLQLTSRAATKSGPYIALYMPPSVQEAYSLRYNDTEISALANIVHAAYQSFKDTQTIEDAFESLTNGNPALEGVRTLINQKTIGIADAISKGGAAAIGIERGVVFTPKMELMFEGVNRRAFSYSFIMMPTSHDEAQEINKIIHNFKINSAPDYNDGLGMEMTIPNRWQIEYYSSGAGSDGTPSQNGYLTSIGECFLENISVVYGGDKYIAHEPDAKGSPPSRIQMTLSFRELEIQTKAALENGGILPGQTSTSGLPTAESPSGATSGMPQSAAAHGIP